MGRLIRWMLIAVAATAAVAIAVPFLVPVSHFIPEITRVASQKLGQPVTMQELRLHLLPVPGIVGRGITVGKAGQVRIGELEIRPDLRALLFGRRTVRLIRAERVTIDETAFAIPRGMPKGRPGEPILVRRLVLSRVELKHSKMELPLFDVDAQLGVGLRLRKALIETPDGKLKLTFESKGAGATAVALSARGWTLPAGAPFTFERLEALGLLKGQQLELAKIEGRLYGGQMAGKAQVQWGKEWQVAGEAQLAGVDLVPVQKALGKPAKLSGRLYADASFSTSATSAGRLGDALALEGPFEVVGGIYQGVDLAKAGDLRGQSAAGDATPFEELKGRLELHGGHIKLTELCVRSPKLVAGGNVQIAPDKALSGKLDVSVANTAGFVGVPVVLSGSTEAPKVRPSKGYLIGGAIGTVLLPGIGTSIGLSLGRIGSTSACN